MSTLFAVQSSVRVFGPFMFTAIYDATGLYVVTLLMSGLMFICGIIVLIFYKRLAPFEDRYNTNDNEEPSQIEILHSEDE